MRKFHARVARAGLGQVVLDAYLERLVSEGLAKAGGKQRTDSTQVMAAVAASGAQGSHPARRSWPSGCPGAVVAPIAWMHANDDRDRGLPQFF